ncbi:DNA polymerase III subunit delta [Halopseudomonas nanhaiensis]|uniref:DNA polymerase III subunit delta n=1 Tax=Halopseudomonas nanhaiensis TaxID=2830842 RepID=UPI001CBD3454|nr:DNA polymerase III subunit delta [Halopseudomonas nanhaiensis]UAW99185.1 DNA polymerase III subunit delta [Halopseudomonas nanhaiensis]
MKLNAAQLARQLANELAPVYVVSGDEPLLTGELADLIRQACRAAGCEEREVYHVERGFDWSQLYDASHSLSLFSSKRLIELRIPGGKPGDDGAKALLAWLDDLPEDITLLVSLPKLDGSTQRSKWAKALVDHTHTRFVQVWPIEPAQLPNWMRDRLAAAGIQAHPDALELLSTRVEGNLLAAAQEVEKLKLFCQGQVLDVETVGQVVADSARYDVFGLADAMLQGQPQHALRMLNGLRGEGVEAPVILWSLSRELRALSSMADDLARGLPIDRIFAAQRPPVWDKRKPLIAQALKRHPQQAWPQWLRIAQHVDEQIKGQQPGSVWDGLTRIVAEVSGARLML